MKRLNLRIEWQPILITLLLVGGILAGAFYFFQIKPQIDSLEKKVADSEKSLKDCTENALKQASGCQKVYSQSQGKFIVKCPPEQTRSEALAECSKNSLTPEMLKTNPSLAELENAREFLMKICMESRGFEY